MVRERSPGRTSSAQHLSPQKPDRTPLANISAKMQSPSPKSTITGDSDAPVKPATQPEFGKASPLRNPLRRPEPSIFIPKQKPTQKRSPSGQPYSTSANPSAASGNNTSASQGRGFYLPGQRPPPAAPQYSSALAAAQAYASQSSGAGYPSDAVLITKPTNPPPLSQPARPQPTFSSIGPNTYYQPFVPPRQTVDLTKSTDRDDDEAFDPDAAIRAESHNFGEPDPYMYVDSAQANDNIKNLLEGAFDDEEDKSDTRLRRRAKKVANEGKESKGLAAKLAALDVKDEKEDTAPVEEEEEDEEDGTVEGLKVKLLPHQVEGVAWMIDKEIGQRKRNGVLPNGGILADDMGLGKTVQSISLMLTNARPAPDAKPEHPKQKLPGREVSKCTLVVAPLALIKQWEDEIKTKVAKSHALRVLVHHGTSRTKSALELKKNDVVITTYQTLTSEHAGSNMDRPDGSRIGCFGIHWYRIILDEAHSIKNRSAKATQAACALNSWFRWCLTGTPMQNNLDELQSLIKFLRIKPFCELSEWKERITTPMKNGRGGLAMKRLQYFLKAIMKRRTKDILKKDGALNFGGKATTQGEDGAQTSGGGMKIVKREVVTVECDFDDAEQNFYNRLQNRADARLKEMSSKGKNDYIGALVILLRLRQACNHPRLVEMAMNKDKDAMTTGTGGNGSQTPRKQNGDSDMDALTALMGGVSVQSKQCDVCQVDLSASEMRDGLVRCSECEADLAAMRKVRKKSKKESSKKKARSTRNRRVISDDSDDEEVEGQGEWIGEGSEQQINLGKAGGTDDEDAEGGGETLGSIDSDRSADEDEDEDDSPPRARLRRPVIKHESDEDDDDEESNESDSDVPIIAGLQRSGKSHDAPSSKMRRLLRILHAEIPSHKTIVFSQFTSMLDLIEPYLDKSNLRYVRYDGSMRPDEREASLSSLRNDPKCRILLCSLKCGSLGLNLTAASRVVIFEPFWNPFVEEQAIDRVHRLNQTVDVKVYRLTVRNTVEARILDLQERKRELAQAAIEGGKAVGKLSMKDILSLFKHDDGARHEDDEILYRKFGQDMRLLDGPSAGFDQTGDMLRRVKPGKERVNKEHDVFGRRWRD
jgi:SNF2 family DNA or RNA helicase